MIVESGGFRFNFTDAIDAFVFDETDKTKATYHGVHMKAVDIVAEFKNNYLFVEIKDFDDPEKYNAGGAIDDDEISERRHHFRWLKRYLKYKYRDTYIYRYAEDKVDKPIHYVCLLTFDNALNTLMRKFLSKELPTGKPSPRWTKEIAASCQVVNIAKWNANFKRWPMQRIA